MPRLRRGATVELGEPDEPRGLTEDRPSGDSWTQTSRDVCTRSVAEIVKVPVLPRLVHEGAVACHSRGGGVAPALATG